MSPIQDPLPRVASLPSGLVAAPQPVKDATAAAVEAGVAYETAAEERAAVVSALPQAEAADEAADAAAVAAGNALPTSSATDKARDAVGLAGRRVDAAETAYRTAYETMVEVIGANHVEWAVALEEQRAELRAELPKALAAYARSRATMRTITGTIEALEPFAKGWSHPFGGFPSTEQIEREAGAMEFVRNEVISALSATRRYSITEDQVDTVLVELELLGAGERPWAESLRGSERDETDAWELV